MASKDKGLLVVLSAPAGCGKDTVLAEVKKADENVKQSISMTTRAPREGEKDGVDYYFVSKEEFEDLKSSGYVEIDVIGTCAINEWQGIITPQILIKDYEIVGKQDYYF